jgi:hypothetical protein
MPIIDRQRSWSARRQCIANLTRKDDVNAYPVALHDRYIAEKMSLGEGSRAGGREVRMSGHRRLAAVGAVAALALVGAAGSGFAATPQKIYRDLADNGRLDGTYTRAEIERAFNLRQVLRTDKQPTTTPRKPIAVAPAGEAARPPRAAKRSERRVPFSALDVALLVAGGGPLLLIGAGLRRRIVSRASEPHAVSS